MSDQETTATVPEAAAEPPAVKPGRLLAEARARRNQTVADVAQQLKLSAHQVEALEADDYARLPGPVFVKGFVRNYARLMELDGESLVAALGLVQENRSAGAAVPPSHDIPFPGNGTRRWPIIAAAVATLAAIVALFEFVSAPSVPGPAAVPAAIPVSPQAEPARVLPVAPLPLSEPAVTLPPATDASAPQPVPEQAGPVAAPAAEPRSSAARSGMSQLRLTFKTQSWVEVRDRDDRVVFSQLNPAGAEQRIEGRAPLNIVIGNAHGVRLEFNGKAVDLAPHTKVEVARLTLE